MIQQQGRVIAVRDLVSGAGRLPVRVRWDRGVRLLTDVEFGFTSDLIWLKFEGGYECHTILAARLIEAGDDGADAG